MLRSVPLLASAALGAGLARERRLRRYAERFGAAAMESLLRAIDANDPQTGAHVRRVAAYALALADAAGVGERERRTIELGALFHDIGKIHEALFDIVHEARGLTRGQRRAIASHPIRGAEVLAPIAHFHVRLAETVLAHHERWDGSGYPRGKRAGQIPLAARVIAIADTFDAVTHRRRYRGGRTVQAAMEIILQGRGKQFDPDLVDLMLLPPVFATIERLHRNLQRPKPARGRGRRDGSGTGGAPKVRIRWRSRTELPALMRRQAVKR